MSKRSTGQEDHTAWFVDLVIKCHEELDCPHDARSVAVKLSTFITSMRNQDDDDDADYDSFQMDLFNFLKEDVNARSRPIAFVMEITNRLCDLIDDKQFTSANVGIVVKLLGVVKVKHMGRPPQPAIRLRPSPNHPRVDLHLSWVAESSIVVLLQLLLRLLSRQRIVDVLLGYCVGHYLIILLSLLTNAMYAMVRFTLHYCVAYN